MHLTRAEYFRFRTGASGLTDDELILFDWFAKAALLGYSCTSPLYAEESGLHMNLPFQPHTIPDAELRDKIEHWHATGLLQSDPELGKHCYSLTPSSAALWEAERLPVWERYYDTCQYTETYPGRPGRPRPKHGEELFVITSPSRKIASQVLQSAIRSGYVVALKRHRTYHLKRWPTEDFPWPRFRRAWQIRLRVESDRRGGWRQVDWERREQERTGWCDPQDLIALRLGGIVPWPGDEDRK